MKALAGTSPSDFIRIVRLNYALQLLKSRRYSVAEISEFTRVAILVHSFKKHFQQSPADWSR
ncbi:MAG TPA: AraC family transcriptional regulator [Prolixibacteraceae bacterium]|nr:AraC family transcriptional regulator [Prolixibacteraceae bacterium]